MNRNLLKSKVLALADTLSETKLEQLLSVLREQVRLSYLPPLVFRIEGGFLLSTYDSKEGRYTEPTLGGKLKEGLSVGFIFPLTEGSFVYEVYKKGLRGDALRNNFNLYKFDLKTGKSTDLKLNGWSLVSMTFPGRYVISNLVYRDDGKLYGSVAILELEGGKFKTTNIRLLERRGRVPVTSSEYHEISETTGFVRDLFRKVKREKEGTYLVGKDLNYDSAEQVASGGPNRRKKFFVDRSFQVISSDWNTGEETREELKFGQMKFEVPSKVVFLSDDLILRYGEDFNEQGGTGEYFLEVFEKSKEGRFESVQLLETTTDEILGLSPTLFVSLKLEGKDSGVLTFWKRSSGNTPSKFYPDYIFTVPDTEIQRLLPTEEDRKRVGNLLGIPELPSVLLNEVVQFL